jgi:hypothetical protein
VHRRSWRSRTRPCAVSWFSAPGTSLFTHQLHLISTWDAIRLPAMRWMIGCIAVLGLCATITAAAEAGEAPGRWYGNGTLIPVATPVAVTGTGRIIFTRHTTPPPFLPAWSVECKLKLKGTIENSVEGGVGSLSSVQLSKCTSLNVCPAAEKIQVAAVGHPWTDELGNQGTLDTFSGVQFDLACKHAHVDLMSGSIEAGISPFGGGTVQSGLQFLGTAVALLQGETDVRYALEGSTTLKAKGFKGITARA